MNSSYHHYSYHATHTPRSSYSSSSSCSSPPSRLMSMNDYRPHSGELHFDTPPTMPSTPPSNEQTLHYDVNDLRDMVKPSAASIAAPPVQLSQQHQLTSGSTVGGPSSKSSVSQSHSTSSSTSPRLLEINSLSSFTAEFFVYLWFAPPTSSKVKYSSQQNAPTDRFSRFCQDLLATTQVSHSVVILALLLVSKLKAKNEIEGCNGSEFRALVISLAIANKVLDDNTYTAKTWADVSSLELKPIVAGEAEFLRGLEWCVHVTEKEFNAWVKLLQGHIATRKAQRNKADELQSASRWHRRSPTPPSELHGLGFDLQSAPPEPKRRRVHLVDDVETYVEQRTRPTAIHLPPAASRPVTANAPSSQYPSLAAFSFGSGPSSAPVSTYHTPQLTAAISPRSGRSIVHPAASHPSCKQRPPVARAAHLVPTHTSRHRHSHSIPPHILMETVSSSTAPAFAHSGVPAMLHHRPSSSGTGQKRRADQAFEEVTTTPYHLNQSVAPQPQRSVSQANLQAPWLSRSFSAGCSPALQRPIHVHSGHMYPSPANSMSNTTQSPYQISPQFFYSRDSTDTPRSMSGPVQDYRRSSEEEQGPFSVLADGFSPHPNLAHRRLRPEQLGYYSLAAGQRHGLLHEASNPAPENSLWQHSHSSRPFVSSQFGGPSPSPPRNISPRTTCSSPLSQEISSTRHPQERHSPVEYHYASKGLPATTSYPTPDSRSMSYSNASCTSVGASPLVVRPSSAFPHHQFANRGPPGIYWNGSNWYSP